MWRDKTSKSTWIIRNKKKKRIVNMFTPCYKRERAKTEYIYWYYDKNLVGNFVAQFSSWLIIKYFIIIREWWTSYEGISRNKLHMIYIFM